MSGRSCGASSVHLIPTLNNARIACPPSSSPHPSNSTSSFPILLDHSTKDSSLPSSTALLPVANSNVNTPKL
ncbi:hypothetical protein IEQ34_006753 [Dendrobium chrysotoxum]|uniref:Uncharacterized protein n=1 Tax=Dendrobium chrysotoxum TaxID=161865 RepID=A0AAV7H7X5_DENCH|nr:hypothetical protein IEQ34_006753 [Dendrobium chrysotoxum]